jgi:lipopolysaccharide exporter
MDVKTSDTPVPTQGPSSTPPALANDETKRAGHALLWKGLQLGTSRGVSLLGTLILGRLLTPQDWGLVAIATVAITTVMTATETGMTNALVQATNRDREHYDVAWSIGLVRGLVVFTVLCGAAPLVAQLFGDKQATSLVRLMALLPLLNSINSPRMTDLMRELKFSRIAVVAILAVLVEVSVSITLASRLGGAAVILGKVSGAATTAVGSYLIAPYLPRFRSSYSAARELVAFGRWLFAINVTAVLANFVTYALVARNLSVAAVGRFNYGDRLAEAPTQLANDSLGAVAFPLYARLRADPPRLQEAVQAHFIGLMFLLLPASGLLIGVALPIQERVLGDQWVGTAPIIVMLVLSLALEVSFNVCYWLLQALGHGGRLFAAELTQYIVLITAVALLVGPYGLWGIGAARILTACVVAYAGYRAAPPWFGSILRRTVRTIVCIITLSGLAGTAAWFGALMIPGTVGIGAGLALGGACYLLLLLLVDRPWQLGVRHALALFFPMLGEKSAG